MASPTPLLIQSSIHIDTSDGRRTIQLCFGDITSTSVQLQAQAGHGNVGPPAAVVTQQPHDIILVSAIGGNYVPTPRSVVGALERNLHISVHELAKNKQEDLRKHLHCWWSKPLPAGLPYRQLLCFETPRPSYQHPEETVGNVFRCLVAIFRNEERTVITPLLCSGGQKCSPGDMLKALIGAAVKWIQAGLPMKCLNIVVLSDNADRLNHRHEQLVEIFNDFKEKVEKASKKKNQQQEMEMRVEYDLYLSYDEKDERKVMEFIKLLKSKKKDLKLFSDHQQMQENSAWQEDMYNAMIKCRKVVAFLSPSYLQSTACVEQYNMALCCKRSVKRDLLAPFYIDTIANMPTYMALVQYADCRCDSSSVWLQAIEAFVNLFEKQGQLQLQPRLLAHYDIFLSYSHCNADQAEQLLQALQGVAKQHALNIFFDIQELKTGVHWVQQLYWALDNSSTIITLLSAEYMKSQVCQEEYNLALMKHLAKTHADSLLLPVLIEPIETLAIEYEFLPIIDATKQKKEVFKQIAREIAAKHCPKESSRKFRSRSQIVTGQKGHLDADLILMEHRRSTFHELFEVHGSGICHRRLQARPEPEQPSQASCTVHSCRHQRDLSGNSPQLTEQIMNQNIENCSPNTENTIDDNSTFNCDVAFIYDSNDLEYCDYLCHLITSKCSGITTSIGNVSAKDQIHCLESARLIIALLSPNLICCSKLVDEYDIAMARQRQSKDRLILYTIRVQKLPKWPTYFHIVPCRIDCTDPLWKNLIRNYKISQQENTDSQNFEQCGKKVCDIEEQPSPSSNGIKQYEFNGVGQNTNKGVLLTKILDRNDVNLAIFEVLALTVASEDLFVLLNIDNRIPCDRQHVLNNIMHLLEEIGKQNKTIALEMVKNGRFYNSMPVSTTNTRTVRRAHVSDRAELCAIL